ncbi:MAG: PAS domain-containing protein, partial [Desulfobacteraceae bacterium]|nr:PAS domain-containing protein [Desulfobacteraceae bacterium]
MSPKPTYCLNFALNFARDKKLINKTPTIENLLGFAGMAYIEADIDLQVTAWNQGAENLFGYSEKDSLGSFLYKLIPMDKKTLIHCKKTQMQSISHVNYQGKKIQCEITYAPTNNLKAKKIGIALLAMDVSSRLKEDGDLEQQKQY